MKIDEVTGTATSCHPDISGRLPSKTASPPLKQKRTCPSNCCSQPKSGIGSGPECFQGYKSPGGLINSHGTRLGDVSPNPRKFRRGSRGQEFSLQERFSGKFAVATQPKQDFDTAGRCSHQASFSGQSIHGASAADRASSGPIAVYH